MRTPLFEEHVALNARIVDFHGWEMPVWYTGIKDEHMATRTSVGLFDASHMGEIFVSGDGAVAFLENILTRDISSMKAGKVLYTFFLNETGGIIDDLTVYCITPSERYMLCVNASNIPHDLEWIQKQNLGDAVIEDKSPVTALLALQGPNAGDILKACLDFDLESIRYFTFSELNTPEYGDIIVSKTGYTGAGGAELFLPADKAASLWNSLVGAGATPCGLGARDTLRLEMGYPLHGNDIDEGTTPFEAGLSFAVDMDKPDFIGKKALAEQREKGLTRRLTGLELLDKGVPRQGYPCMKNETQVGIITSGSISPVTGGGIALAYLDVSVQDNEEIAVEIRSKHLRALVKKPPFVQGTISK
ncbi:MAG TPA: glycine cleavage system aminomethyltransferase GcvT [Deltaproteobacteria bacterium]|nr:glycine cleavage system aminomethyltransferase GcvT [Deltaproteobacteria bacterium]HPJ93051.1 glycine cleavage system aminomethyltransferase GcvT [Deltaproteobacteria bacterium]